MKRLHPLLFTAILMLPLAASGAVEVSSHFSPPRVAFGDRLQYIVEIAETSTGTAIHAETVRRLPIPADATVALRNGRISSSRETNMTNGETRLTQRLIFDAFPQSEGRNTVPTYVFSYKGENVTVPEAEVLVLERGSNAAPTVDELIFLEADLPERLYVGESVEVPLTLFVSDQVNLQDLRKFGREGDGFTVTEELPDAERGSRMRDGRRYATFSWPLKITPLSAGDQSLGFRFEVVARLPGRSGAGTRDPFGRSGVLDGFFNQAQRFNLYSREQTVQVLPLPGNGNTEAFTGGIGDFGLKVSVDRSETVKGEPVMLSMVVSGKGNFDRISAPRIAKTDDWRSYPPEEHFEASDDLGLEGSKRFDFVLLPNRSGELEIPGVRFSFFDPVIEEYVELSSLPLEMAVSPAPGIPGLASVPTADSRDEESSVLGSGIFRDPLDTLLALDYGQRPARIPQATLLGSPWFIAINALALLFLGLLGATIRRRNRLAKDSVYALKHQAQLELKKLRKEVAMRASSGDAPGFHQAAQQALRIAVTRRLGRPMHAASHAELLSTIDSVGLSSRARSAIASLARESDETRFSARGTHPTDLLGQKDQLDQILKEL